MDVGGPAARRAGDERAGGRERVQEAENFRTAELLGEGREERQRHAEEHGDDVHGVRPDELGTAAGEAEALDRKSVV